MSDRKQDSPTSVRLSESLRKDLEAIAERDERTLSQQIVYFLKEAVKADKKKNQSTDD